MDRHAELSGFLRSPPGGCGPEDLDRHPSERSAAVRIELVHHEGCPLADAARALVTDCLRQVGVDEPIIERVARYPSPSVLVNGVDVMGAPDKPVGDACRLDIPTRDRVLAALSAAAS